MSPFSNCLQLGMSTFGQKPKLGSTFGRNRKLAETMVAETETGAETFIRSNFGAKTEAVAEIRSFSNSVAAQLPVLKT